MSLLACGLSAATKSTPLSIRLDTKWTFLARRSNFAMIRVALAFLGGSNSSRELRPIVALAALDLAELRAELAVAAGNMTEDRFALGAQAKTAPTLAIDRSRPGGMRCTGGVIWHSVTGNRRLPITEDHK
jgi:hypothetical protein